MYVYRRVLSLTPVDNFSLRWGFGPFNQQARNEKICCTLVDLQRARVTGIQVKLSGPVKETKKSSRIRSRQDVLSRNMQATVSFTSPSRISTMSCMADEYLVWVIGSGFPRIFALGYE